MERNVLEFIREHKIIAIVRGIPSTQIVQLVQAMVDGGVRCVEVTFDQSSEEKRQDTLKAIAAIRETFGDQVSVGAGTVMTVEQVHQAREAGAEYIISPNVNEAVIRETQSLIAPYVEADPTAFCSYTDHLLAVDTLLEVCRLRAESIRGQLNGDYPATLAQQAEHPGTGVNASHVDLRDLGGFQDLETANERQAAALAAVAQRRAD